MSYIYICMYVLSKWIRFSCYAILNIIWGLHYNCSGIARSSTTGPRHSQIVLHTESNPL